MTATLTTSMFPGEWLVNLPEGCTPRVNVFQSEQRARMALVAFEQQTTADRVDLATLRMEMARDQASFPASTQEPVLIQAATGRVWWVSYRGRRPVRLAGESSVAEFVQGSYDLDIQGWAAWSRLSRGDPYVRLSLPQRWSMADLDALDRPHDVTAIHVDLTRHMRSPSGGWLPEASRQELPRQETPPGIDFAGIRVVASPHMPPGQVVMLTDGTIMAGPTEAARVAASPRLQPPAIRPVMFRDAVANEWIVHEANGDITRFTTQTGALQFFYERGGSPDTSRADGPRQPPAETQNPSRDEGPRHTPQERRPAPDPARAPRRVLRLAAEPEEAPTETLAGGRGAEAPRPPGRRLRGLGA